MVAKLLRTEDDAVLAILRMALGLVFFAHGVQDLGWLDVYSSNSALEVVPETVGISASFFFSGTAELIGGLGLILGLFSRIAAFGLATNILAAIMLVHGRHGFFMNWLNNQGGEGIEYHLLALAITLSVLLNGSGAFSFDQALLRRFAPKIALPFSARPVTS
jgi:putative oxidoreductase